MAKPKTEKIPEKQRYRLYSIKEAAVYLGCGLYTVRQFVWGKVLPVVKFGKKQYIDLPSDETISRCIRQAQQDNPDLKSDNEIDRYEQAEQFRLNFKREEK